MEKSSDVIAAIATPPGRGGISIVRVSGPDLRAMGEALTGRALVPGRILHARILDGHGDAIDDGIVLYFVSPNSFTGEDVIELQGHGGPVVSAMLLARTMSLGARLAEPGEFTRRAFLNDRMDLAQAEAVADLIDASTAGAARAAMRSLSGEFSAQVHEICDRLVTLRMFVEATLDFPDEDIDVLDRREIEARLTEIRSGVGRMLEGGRQGSVLRNGLRVVLVGRPNVGKSSVLNRLAREDVAIVTPVPGTTRDAIRQMISLGDVPVHIIDTAGIRESTDTVESIGIGRTWQEVARADVIVLLLEAGHAIGPEEASLMERLPSGVPRIIVHNKIDLAGWLPERKETAAGIEVGLSALNGTGMDLLRQALLDVVGVQTMTDDTWMARERHLVALSRARDALADAAACLNRSELVAEELRRAHEALGEISGRFTADDLLGEIFSRFCIGK